MTTTIDWRSVDRCLTTPSFFSTGEHHAVLARLRSEDPVHWTEGVSARPFWSVTRYADCTRVLEDAEVFSSEHGGILLETPEYPPAERRYALGYGSNPTMTDPPRHWSIRRPFNKHWAAPSVGRLRDKVQACTDDIMSEVLPRGRCDFVDDVAAQLPARVVCDMMGVPEPDRADIRRYCGGFLSPHDPRYQIDGDPLLTQTTMMHRLHDYMLQLALQRRLEPLDDFTSVAAQLMVEGEPLDDRDLGWWAFSFVAAGLESTRNGLAVGVLELLKHPEQTALLHADQTIVPTAVEEILRWVTPSKYKWRIATRDCAIGERAVRKGDWVVCWIVSANRDEDVFVDPHLFDVRREPNPHLSFSTGEHSCIGRHLARLELQVALAATLERMANLRIDGPFEWQHSMNHTALVNLPVAFDPV